MFSVQPGEPPHPHQPQLLAPFILDGGYFWGEDGQSMQLTFVIVKDSQCNHGVGVVRACWLHMEGVERSRLI